MDRHHINLGHYVCAIVCDMCVCSQESALLLRKCLTKEGRMEALLFILVSFGKREKRGLLSLRFSNGSSVKMWPKQQQQH